MEGSQPHGTYLNTSINATTFHLCFWPSNRTATISVSSSAACHIKDL